jgi:putative transposase
MIERLATEHGTRELCELLEVSSSGYYAWSRRGSSAREKADRMLGEQIEAIHKESRGTYGSPRITEVVRARGTRCSRKRVARIMRQKGLRGVQKARFRPQTTDSRHAHQLSPNRLDGVAEVDRPNQVWVSDITYIATKQGWMYLSAMMDLGTRTLKGWALKDSLRTSLVSDAFSHAVFRYRPQPGLIVHSDHGSQYASNEFRNLLARHKALGSMGRIGNCYDNAAMESFFATLKTELVRGQPFNTRQEAKQALFDYIEIFYNRQRLHSSLGYRSPVDYEAQLMVENTAPYVSEKSGQDQISSRTNPTPPFSSFALRPSYF